MQLAKDGTSKQSLRATRCGTSRYSHCGFEMATSDSAYKMCGTIKPLHKALTSVSFSRKVHRTCGALLEEVGRRKVLPAQEGASSPDRQSERRGNVVNVLGESSSRKERGVSGTPGDAVEEGKEATVL